MREIAAAFYGQADGQACWYSPTQTLSHDDEQQTESTAQTCCTHVSHELASLLPVVHGLCAHVVGGFAMSGGSCAMSGGGCAMSVTAIAMS